MEGIRHIKETQRKDLLHAQTEPGETGPVRVKIEQHDTYDIATETHPEQIAVREFLNAVDEEALKDIFSEYFIQSGSDEDAMNWIPLKDVRITYTPPDEGGEQLLSSGNYSIKRGVQLLSSVLWRDTEVTLWTLIHEQCHAISQDRFRTYPTLNDAGEIDGARSVTKSGVRADRYTTKLGTEETEEHVSDTDINEGITELLTERIFREYKKRTGSERYSTHPAQPDQHITETEKAVALRKFDSYERPWQNAKLYIGIISALTDVPEDVVENAVIRTYIRNGYILPDHDPEINAMLDEVHPRLATILFSMLNSTKDESPSLSVYVDYLSKADIPEDVRQKIVRALHKIREEWGEAYKLAPFTV